MAGQCMDWEACPLMHVPSQRGGREQIPSPPCSLLRWVGCGRTFHWMIFAVRRKVKETFKHELPFHKSPTPLLL